MLPQMPFSLMITHTNKKLVVIRNLLAKAIDFTQASRTLNILRAHLLDVFNVMH